jgi:uncharacterized protein (DUF433 family)
MISAGSSRIEIVKHFATITPEKVLKGTYPSLAKLKKEIGDDKVEMALAILILDTSKAFDEQLDKDTAVELAAEVHATYYYYTLEECFFILQKFKHRQLYGKLTLNKILTAFDEYQKERISLADNLSYNAHIAVSDAGTNRGNTTVSVRKLLPNKNKK